MANRNEDRVFVYADWTSLGGARLMGVLSAQRLRGKEIFSFEYDEEWLKKGKDALFLDPNLGYYKGKQFAPGDKPNFGLFLDSAPDRWGRMLMKRREAWTARQEEREERNLYEIDYLLGVYDGHRAGGLRFKSDPTAEFLNSGRNMATPPWTSLRELEHASLQLERDDSIEDPGYIRWLGMLVDPGSSLGGARPKAGVLDERGRLWIAKFPSSRDGTDVGAWEMVLHEIAVACGLNVPDAGIRRFSGKHHTYLTRRFDRTDNQGRIHFASAMTLLGHGDGADFMDGAGYLDMTAFILRHGARVKEDLEQLWRRVLFNILVSNTDDHLRNHGFILTDEGWRLSPAFDMNPNEYGDGLTLNVSEESNEQDVSLALSTATYHGLKKQEAEGILLQMRREISEWRRIAQAFGIPSSEVDRKKRAFRLVDRNSP